MRHDRLNVLVLQSLLDSFVVLRLRSLHINRLDMVNFFNHVIHDFIALILAVVEQEIIILTEVLLNKQLFVLINFTVIQPCIEIIVIVRCCNIVSIL